MAPPARWLFGGGAGFGAGAECLPPVQPTAIASASPATPPRPDAPMYTSSASSSSKGGRHLAGAAAPKAQAALTLLFLALVVVVLVLGVAVMQLNETVNRLLEERAPGGFREAASAGGSFVALESGEWEGEDAARARRLMYSIGSSNTGCYQVSGDTELDVSGANCNSLNCPSCFVSGTTVASEFTLTITACSSHRWGIGTGTEARNGVWQYLFINRDKVVGAFNMNITDGTNSWLVPPRSHVIAYCDSDGDNTLMFQTTQVPTLTVADGLTASGAVALGTGGVTIADGGLTITSGGLTLSAGAFDASSSDGAFATSMGANTLNGATTVSGTNTFEVTGGVSSLLGGASLGQSGGAATSEIWGMATLQEGLTVTSGGITVTAGGFTLTAGAFNAGSSTDAFTTSSGDNTLSGNTLVSLDKTFTVGSGTGSFGATTLKGTLTVEGASTLAAAVDVTAGGLTVSAGGIDVAGGSLVISDTTGAFDASASTGAFETTQGAVTLHGHTTLDGAKNFVHGATGGITGTATFYGDVTVGEATNAAATTLYGETRVKAGGFYLEGGDFDASASTTGAFITTGGAHTINGDVTVADSHTLTVGSAGTAGATTLYGNLQVGENSAGQYGTSTLNGLVTVNQGGFTLADGAFNAGGSGGDFTTSSGSVTLSGDTQISASKSLTVGAVGDSGDITLYGNVIIGDSSNTVAATVYGTATVSGELTAQNGFTMSAGEFDASGGTVFKTGTGAHTFGGSVMIKDGKSFTVGENAGSAGATTLLGTLTVGADGSEAQTSDFYGKVTVKSQGLLVDGGIKQASGAFEVTCDSSNTASISSSTITMAGDATVTGTFGADGVATFSSDVTLGVAGSGIVSLGDFTVPADASFKLSHSGPVLTCSGTGSVDVCV